MLWYDFKSINLGQIYPALGNYNFPQISLHRSIVNVGGNKTSQNFSLLKVPHFLKKPCICYCARIYLGSDSRAAEVYLCLEAHRKCMIKIRITQNFFMFSLPSYVVFLPQFSSLNEKDKAMYVINPSQITVYQSLCWEMTHVIQFSPSRLYYGFTCLVHIQVLFPSELLLLFFTLVPMNVD